jgi:hypothetical protein
LMIPTETEVWVECDCCGAACGGPGVVMERWGQWMVCEVCYGKLTNTTAMSPSGVSRASGCALPHPDASEASRVA